MRMLDIKVTKTETPKAKPAKDDPLLFGTIFTDHMFIMDYAEGKGWYDPRIVPYGDITLPPAATIFHYGQGVFEGLKAYNAVDGGVNLFRPDMNAKRSNRSSDRLCIPEIPEEDFVQAIEELVELDKDWIPNEPDHSLYIRPFIIGTDPFLGLRTSAYYKFIIILSPVGPYYPEGLDPVGIWIEDDYVRAVRGGIGEAKTGGNYAASILSQVKAHDEGYSQVLWLDGVYRKYIEEVGAMNIFFKIDGKVVTPMLNGSILPGITRDSVIQICKEWGYDVIEKRIDIAEIEEAWKNGTLEEVWGTGTAAVISPVGKLRMGDEIMQVQDGGIGELSQRLYDEVTGIQLGKVKDTCGWIVKID